MLFLAACSSTKFAAVNLPSRLNGMKVVHDVAFGTGKTDKADIFLPASPKGSPVIVFYYGGRWESGTKEDYHFVGSALAKRGFIAVLPDYRKYPEVKFPAFVDDTAKALAWTIDHIGEYGGDNGRIYVSGHSSGAHMASLVLTDAHYLAAYGKRRSDVKAFVGLAGPYSFVPEDKDVKDMFGPPENYPLMQATTFIDGKQPPMLLMWGAKDTLVGRINMDKMAAAAHEKGGCMKTKIYPELDHVWMVATLSWLGSSGDTVLDDMVDFFNNPECAKPKR